MKKFIVTLSNYQEVTVEADKYKFYPGYELHFVNEDDPTRAVAVFTRLGWYGFREAN